jgi:hypothetical protein
MSVARSGTPDPEIPREVRGFRWMQGTRKPRQALFLAQANREV